jgi:peroxiredoxin
MRFVCRFVCLSLVACSTFIAVGNADDEKSPIGKKIEGFKLQDHLGTVHDLVEWSNRDVLVVAFLGTECPLAKLYGPRLAELAGEYSARGVGFVAIDANQQDSLAEMTNYARAHKIDFPFLKDPANAVADQFGAVRTPEVFVLDKQRVVRYWGRIDDQYGIGYSRAEPQRKDLALALDELLAGKAVSQPVAKSIGCHIGRANRISPRGEITYSKDVAPILQKHCVQCHREGEVAPFTLTSHEDAVNWSSTIREVVAEKRMPPWHTNAEPGKFLNDRRLSDREQTLLFNWIDNGMPAGNPSDLPPPAKFSDGWQIAKPDLVVEMPKPYTVPARGTVQYQYFPINHTFEEDKWIVAAEARPGNRAVVHHLILFFVPPGQRPQEAVLLNSAAIFAPGMPPWQARPGTAKRIPAGSKLFIQAHYTPNGTETTDLSRAGLVFVDGSQVEKRIMSGAVINQRFRIPPEESNFPVEGSFRFNRDMQIVSLFPHMHLRGKSFRIDAVDPQGQRELLLDVPRYDFNWQNTYAFAEPVPMREGAQLQCVASYDNSSGNPANPDPTKTVTWGDQTWEEMMVAQFDLVLDDQDLRLGLPKVGPPEGGEYEVTFRHLPKSPAEAVYLAGSFNEWKPTGHKMEGPDASGFYTTKVKLKAGNHEYKFVIDGKTWRADPGNSEFVGQYQNSLLRIGAAGQSSADKK